MRNFDFFFPVEENMTQMKLDGQFVHDGHESVQSNWILLFNQLVFCLVFGETPLDSFSLVL